MPTQIQTGNEVSKTTPFERITPNSTPIPEKKIQTALSPTPTRFPHPVISSDLLFLSKNRLYRWDRLTNYSVIIAENVSAYSVSAAMKSVAMLRSQGISANGLELYDLDILEFEMMQVHSIARGLSQLDSMVLSPDGQWIVYHETKPGGKVIAVEIKHPESRIILGNCIVEENNSCDSLTWSPDNFNVLWTDDNGIWLGDIRKGISTLINPGKVQVPDPDGQTQEIDAAFDAPRWSPVGRYVLVDVAPLDTMVKWQAVLDVRSSRLARILDTYSTSAEKACVAWLYDGSLVVGNVGELDLNTVPHIQSWHLTPTDSDILTQYKTFPIDLSTGIDNHLPAKVSNQNFQDFDITWLQPAGSEGLLLGLQSSDGGEKTPLFKLDLLDGSTYQVALLEEGINSVKWSPDGSGFLIIYSSGRILFYDIFTVTTYDILPGQVIDPSTLFWLMPETRN